MLVLTRKRGEAITIGEDIEITVLEVKGDQVKLGIKAPKETDIFRKEIIESISNENQQALQNPTTLQQLLKIKNR